MLVKAVQKRPQDYPVVWRAGEGRLSTGKLELGRDDLVLSGRGAERLEIAYRDLSSVEIGRSSGERINGDKSVMLERHAQERVLIGAVGGIGLVAELAELLAQLRTACAVQARVAVVVPFKRGSADTARRLIDEGPPFEIGELGLERHHVFVSENEAVFVFEGRDAEAVVAALSRSPNALKAAVRWRSGLAGRPRIAQERFSWARDGTAIRSEPVPGPT
jgi:hypothetical protein